MQHYPEWARTFAQKYLSKTMNHFTLYGNVRDMVMVVDEVETETETETETKVEKSSPDKKRKKKAEAEKHVSFSRFTSFLGDELFGSRDLVLFYDRSGGIHFRDEETRLDFESSLPPK